MGEKQTADYQRLNKIKSFANLSTDVDLAREIGSKKLVYSIYNIKKGESKLKNGKIQVYKMPKNIAEKITARWPEINYQWVMTGQGEMLNSPAEQKQAERPNSVTMDRSVLDTIVSQQATIRMLTEVLHRKSLKNDVSDNL